MMDKTQRAAAFPPGFGAARPRGTVEMDLGAVPMLRPFFSTAPRAPIRGEGGKKALMVENGANGNNASGRETAGIASYRPHPACEGSGSILGGGVRGLRAAGMAAQGQDGGRTLTLLSSGAPPCVLSTEDVWMAACSAPGFG